LFIPYLFGDSDSRAYFCCLTNYKVKIVESYIESKLQERINNHSLRKLSNNHTLSDFCSNDYLGFAKSETLREAILKKASEYDLPLAGATGSRLISGNHLFTEELENEISAFHDAESGLIFNSGYDANLGIFSSLPQRGDTIICDELIHASIIDGTRLSFANRYTFKHNDIDSLEEKLKTAKGRIYIAIESIYSMDGDEAPLEAIVNLAEKYDAAVIVDEAHATGIFGDKGRGLVHQYNLQQRIFARVITFSKALGCHGAIVLSNKNLRSYLVNFARSFIYTTAASPLSHISVAMAYSHLKTNDFQKDIAAKISFFRQTLNLPNHCLISSNSPIQCLIVGGNERTRALAQRIRNKGMDVRAILHPTVPEGKERLRICLHTFNSDIEIEQLATALKENL